MLYIEPVDRVIVDKHVEKIGDYINQWEILDCDRLSKVIASFLVCVYQERLPKILRQWQVKEETIVSCDLISVILDKFDMDKRAGVLNYCVARIIALTIIREGVSCSRIQAVEETLDRIKDAVYHGWLKGVIGCVKNEFRRRVSGVYADREMKENGDVF
jgi:hypothetical protein